MPSVDLGKVVGNDGVGIPSGGSAGQVLVKQSSSNYDTAWGNYEVPFGTCSTEGATAAKTVTVSPAITSLVDGQLIIVSFEQVNAATDPTLNVNGLGAKAIKRNGSTSPGTNSATSWLSYQRVLLRYESVNARWVMLTQPQLVDATTITPGIMSATDKAKLDNITVSNKTVENYLPSNIWSEQYHSIAQYGKMIIVNICGKLATAPSGQITLFNNLPNANGTAYGTVVQQETGVGGPISINNGNTYITTRGTVWIDTIKTGYVWGQLIYFTT